MKRICGGNKRSVLENGMDNYQAELLVHVSHRARQLTVSPGLYDELLLAYVMLGERVPLMSARRSCNVRCASKTPVVHINAISTTTVIFVYTYHYYQCMEYCVW